MSVYPAILNVSSPWFYAVRLILLLSLTLITYGPALSYGFVFDDYEFIVNNPYIKSLHDAAHLWEHFPITRLVGMYSFAFNYYVNQLHPAGYHIFNVIVHILATGMVWALAHVLLRRHSEWNGQGLTRELPFITALFFLVHPGQTQAVTYISQRFESMAALFYITSFTCYVYARTSTKQHRYILFLLGSAITAVLGILTKETMLTLPLMLLAYEWICHPHFFQNKRRLAVVMAGLIGFVVFMEYILHGRISDFWTKSIPSESHDGDIITAGPYVLTQARVLLTFLRLLIVPINQNLEYDYPLSNGLLEPPATLIGILVFVILSGAVIFLRRRQPLLALGIIWLLGTFAINLLPRSNVIFEHKLYLLSFGFFLGMTALILRQRRYMPGLLIASAVLIVCWASLTVWRNQVWKNERILWEDIARKSPQKSRVLTNLGRVYGEEGDLDKALESFNRAIAVNPKNSTALLNRGVIYSRLNRIDEALADYNKALKVDPVYYSVYIKRAWLYYHRRDIDKAMNDLSEAITIAPNATPAHAQRAMLYFEQGKMGSAYADAETVIKYAPYDFFGRTIRGAVLFRDGKYEQALSDFRLAYAAEPDNIQAIKNLVECLQVLGRTEEANGILQRHGRTGTHQ